MTITRSGENVLAKKGSVSSRNPVLLSAIPLCIKLLVSSEISYFSVSLCLFVAVSSQYPRTHSIVYLFVLELNSVSKPYCYPIHLHFFLNYFLIHIANLNRHSFLVFSNFFLFRDECVFLSLFISILCLP